MVAGTYERFLVMIKEMSLHSVQPEGQRYTSSLEFKVVLLGLKLDVEILNRQASRGS